MNFSNERADSKRRLSVIAFVLVLHALLIYGLASGLARKVVDAVRVPIEVKVIAEPSPAPPAPEAAPPPPPKFAPPPPAFVPPPEVVIATAPPVAPTVADTAPLAPTAVVQQPSIAPEALPAAEPAAPAASSAAVASVRSACTTHVPPKLPAVSVTGRITMLGTIEVKDGKVLNVSVTNIHGSSDRQTRRALVAAVESAMRAYVCPGDWPELTQEFAFNIH